MHLEHLRIVNFRAFKELDLTLNAGLNVLVGENDSGKTALIDSVRYVLGTNSSDRTFIDESDFHNDEKELSIQLKFTNVERYAHVFIEHLTYEENLLDNQAVLYVQLTAKNSGLERRGYPFILTEVRSGENGNGLILDTPIRTFLSTTYLKPLRDSEAELSAGRGSRLSQILNSSKELSDPKAIEKILKLIANTNKELVKPGQPIHTTSQRIQNEYLHELIFSQEKPILKAIIDIAGIKDFDPTDDKERHKKHLRAILEALSLSLTNEPVKHGLGYSNLLFIATELLLLEQEEDNEFPLLLIEEPEAHLHPQLQMKLLQFITKKSKDIGTDQGLQCILSTHSPNVSSKTDLKNLIIVNNGNAFSLRPEETRLEKDNYIFLTKFLDATKANLFFARGIILVEGDAETILLPTIANLLNMPLEDHGISVVNIGNTGWKHFAKIFLRSNKKVEYPGKVSVIRDLDLWPECAQETKNNLYGFIPIKNPSETGKGGNLWRWIKDNDKGRIFDYANNLKKDNDGSTLENSNLKVFVSNYWTLEYCLSIFGLFDECYTALNESTEGIRNISGTNEDKATYIQREVRKTKTDFAMKLALILEAKYQDSPRELKEKLPPYLVAAIEHITDAIPAEEERKGRL